MYPKTFYIASDFASQCRPYPTNYFIRNWFLTIIWYRIIQFISMIIIISYYLFLRQTKYRNRKLKTKTVISLPCMARKSATIFSRVSKACSISRLFFYPWFQRFICYKLYYVAWFGVLAILLLLLFFWRLRVLDHGYSSGINELRLVFFCLLGFVLLV